MVFWRGSRKAASADANEPASNKLIVVSHDAHFFGGQLLALHIVRHLTQEVGFDVATVLLGGGNLRPEFEQLGLVIDFSVPGWRKLAPESVRREQQQQLSELHRLGYRHAICNTTPSGRIVSQLRQAKIRTLALVHELPNLIEQNQLQDVAKDLAALADGIVFPAVFVRDRFATLAPLDPAKTYIKPQGLFRTNPYRGNRVSARLDLQRSLGLPASTKIVLAAGPGDRRKGVDIFCQVAARVIEREPHAHFVWLGDDQTELATDCKAWLSAVGLDASVSFTGVERDPDAYARRMAAADVYLMTSREDPYPSVVLDAMTLGVPVIGFAEAGGFCELLEEGAGILVSFADRAAMADSLLSMLADESRARDCGLVGQRLIDQRFGFPDYVQDLLRMIGAPHHLAAQAT